MGKITREEIANEFAKLEGISLEQAQQEFKRVNEDDIVKTILDIQLAKFAQNRKIGLELLNRGYTKQELKEMLDTDLSVMKKEIIDTLRYIRKYIITSDKEAQ